MWFTCRPTACASFMLSRIYSKSSKVTFLLVRCSLTNISRLVISGYCSTRKTLAPQLATLSATYLLVPLTTEVTTIRVETERITPSRVRNDRSLCVRSVSSAISIGSLSEAPRDLEAFGWPGTGDTGIPGNGLGGADIGSNVVSVSLQSL